MSDRGVKFFRRSEGQLLLLDSADESFPAEKSKEKRRFVFSGIGLRVEIDRGPFRDSTGRTSQRRQRSNSSGLRDWFCYSDCFE